MWSYICCCFSGRKEMTMRSDTIVVNPDPTRRKTESITAPLLRSGEHSNMYTSDQLRIEIPPNPPFRRQFTTPSSRRTPEETPKDDIDPPELERSITTTSERGVILNLKQQLSLLAEQNRLLTQQLKEQNEESQLKEANALEKIKLLEDQLRQKEVEREKIEKESASLGTQHKLQESKLQHEIASLKKEVGELEKTNFDNKNLIERLKKKGTASPSPSPSEKEEEDFFMKRPFEKLKKEKEQLESRIKELAQQVEDEKESKQLLTHQLVKSQEHAKKLQDRLNELERREEELEKREKRVIQREEEMQSQVKILDERMGPMIHKEREELADLRKKREEQEKVIKGQQNKITVLKSRNKSQKDQLSEKDRTILGLESQLRKAAEAALELIPTTPPPISRTLSEFGSFNEKEKEKE